MQQTNALIHSSSPYLLQHAHNPVNWQPWSEDLIASAKVADKLILVSIGYAACHWCHVMEHESFEDEEVAATMNEHFVCIKVDREERPDVDHYYMSAVRLMGLQGGWPLNVIALPDGRPIWGGTYFPKETWKDNLLAIARFFRENREKTMDYGASLQNSIEQLSLSVKAENEVPVSSDLIMRAVEGWKSRFDYEEGGRAGAPKFPMPVNLEFLLYFGWIYNDSDSLSLVKVTLEKMARGGIYDQVGGGFARYSVDENWKVPHFEKMLYDNGQLLSIYSKAYLQFKSEEFKTVVYETVHFLERELLDGSGAFYSSLDADSEGKEGKFYVWKKSELEEVIGEDFALFASYFNVNEKGFWEQGNYILLRDRSDENFADENGITLEELHAKVSKWKFRLLKERSKRVRPGLDDKTLTSWNALAIQGLTDAFRTFRDERFLELAILNARFIVDHLLSFEGKLHHSWKAGKASIDGFLEDYALTIRAFLTLFEVSGDGYWARLAEKMAAWVMKYFYDEERGLFFFSEKTTQQTVTNYFQMEDNVVPASNSVMALNLHRMFLTCGRPQYQTILKKMLPHVTDSFSKYPMAYANWGKLMLKTIEPYFEVVVCGINANILLRDLQSDFRPNVLWAHATAESEIPILKNRFVKGEDLVYVCADGTCRMPVDNAEAAFKLLAK